MTREEKIEIIASEVVNSLNQNDLVQYAMDAIKRELDLCSDTELNDEYTLYHGEIEE